MKITARETALGPKPQEARITALIPTFRRPRLLCRAIKSVLVQGGDELVVKVFDNASNDETGAIVNEIAQQDPRVRYYCQHSNVGPMENFNFAMTQVETDYFALLSDDDMILAGFYRTAIEAFEKNPSALFFCGRTVINHLVEGTVYERKADWPEGLYPPGQESMLRMIRAHYPWTGVVWRSEIVESVGPLDPFGADDNFMVRASALHPFVVSSRECGLLFAHPESYFGNVSANLSEGHSRLSAEHSPYLDHLIGRTVRLQSDLMLLDNLGPTARAMAVEALSTRLRRELTHWLLSKSVPSLRVREVQTIQVVLRSTGCSLSVRVFLVLLVCIFEKSILLSVVVSRTCKVAVALRRAKRRKAVQWSPLQQRIQSYVESIEESCVPIPKL